MKKIVFDFGGVLFRWQPPRLLQRELPHLGLDDPSARALAARFFQSYGGDWADFDRGTVSGPNLVERIARRTGLSADDVQRVVDGVPRELQPIPDSVALLKQLRDAGRRLHFLSNMPASYATHLEEQHSFLSWFHSGVFSARVEMIKPELPIYRLAAARFGHAPDDLVFLDDHLPNVLAARDAGWNALHFHDAVQAESELRTHGWW